MGDVISFPGGRKPPVQLPTETATVPVKRDFDEFCNFYADNLPAMNMLTLEIVKDLDLGKHHEYDVFMLRESLMSLVMRAKGIYHPLQDFTSEYVKTFGGERPTIED